jgi:hypothetical protein
VILASGANEDISLEEFSFDVRNSQGEEFRLVFGEEDPLRRMSGPRLTGFLRQRMEKKSSDNP